MRQHDELDQLSALMDGELAAPERAALEAHVVACEDCRVILDALRSTVAELRALPEPALTEQDSWALRSAISRARRPARRWQRLAWSSGAAAASVIAIVAIVAGLGNGGTADLASGPEEARDSIALQSTSQDYGPASAQQRLLSVAGITTSAPLAAMPPAAGGPQPEMRTPSPTGGGGSTGAFGYTSDSAVRTGEDASQELDACVSSVTGSTQERLVPRYYEAATFEGRPAFLLIFTTEDRYELWVVARPSCEVLYFAQA